MVAKAVKKWYVDILHDGASRAKIEYKPIYRTEAGTEYVKADGLVYPVKEQENGLYWAHEPLLQEELK